MNITFLNPQGNFDSLDSFWTEHPDFGGQLVYVKELALAMGNLGHKVDIITRRFQDEFFNIFDKKYDYYPDNENVRIVRIPCGPNSFLNKEVLWNHLDEWTDKIIEFFKEQEQTPDFITGHYGDGGISAAMIKKKIGIPYSLTGHSLGAQKLDKLRLLGESLETLNKKYAFSTRIEAERITMKYSDLIFVSTVQEKSEQYSHILYKDITKNIDKRFIIASPGANTRVFSTNTQDFDKEYYPKFSEVLKRDIKEERLQLPYIILASRLDPKKNHLGLVKAYAKDEELQKRTNLAISLRGVENAFEDYSKLKPQEKLLLSEIFEIIEQFSLKGKVSFISINSQLELASFYRYMVEYKSIFTLTALYEPFGLAPIEAMSTGLVAVVTKYGGPADVLAENNERYGVLVDVFEQSDIIRGLKEALDNYEEYKLMGIRRVNEKYTWEATAKTYIDAICQVLAQTSLKNEVEIPSYFINLDKDEIPLDFIENKIFETEKKI